MDILNPKLTYQYQYLKLLCETISDDLKYNFKSFEDELTKKNINSVCDKCDKLIEKIEKENPPKDVDSFIGPIKLKYKPLIDSLILKDGEFEKVLEMIQGEDDWLDSRKNRLTGSNYAAAIGWNPYKKPIGLVKDMLWGGFKGNEATRYGTKHEDYARDLYLCYLYEKHAFDNVDIRIDELGLWVSKQFPCFGMSVDGIIYIGDKVCLLEIKCPFRKKLYSKDSRYKDSKIPHYYYTQIMGAGFLRMDSLMIEELHFVTYVPNGIQIEIFRYREEFFQAMFKEMIKFYKNLYLPRWLLKTKNLLKEGEINTINEITCKDDDKNSIRSFSKPISTPGICIYSFGDFGSDFTIENY